MSRRGQSVAIFLTLAMGLLVACAPQTAPAPVPNTSRNCSRFGTTGASASRSHSA